MPIDQEVFEKWSGKAASWEKHRATIRQMFAPVTQALIQDAAIGRGQTVLDVATGTGEPALTVAPLVAPEGKVTAVDQIPQMVAAARRAADLLEIGNVQFEEAFADQLPFPDETFDAVLCRFGVMFFPSPVDAVREMLRVLKPGYKLALAVWHFADKNPFHYSLSRVIQRYVDVPAPAPNSAEPFRFASAGKLRDVLGEAGAAAPAERLLQFTIHAPIPIEDFWTLRFEMSLCEKLGTLSAEQLKELRIDALESLREYSTDSGMSFPAEALIVSGTKARR